jgi:hypothetical protein
METSLHRQLKSLFAPEAERQEMRIDGYRIDAVVGGELIEIQHGSLAAIRGKVKRLLERHRVRVVKPLAVRTLLIRRDRRTGTEISRRWSPRHDSLASLFLDLVHFVDVFPHPRLTLEVLLVEQEEDRVPVNRRWFRARDHRTTDRRLIAIEERRVLRTAGDLLGLVECDWSRVGVCDRTAPSPRPSPPRRRGGNVFTTEDIATACGIPRWLAQKLAYCLRKTGVFVAVGKRRHSWLYRIEHDEQHAAA